MLFSQCRGNERDIFKIALDGTSLFRGSCIDVIKSRLRKNVKAPGSSRIMPVLKEGEIMFRALENKDLLTHSFRSLPAIFIFSSQKYASPRLTKGW